MSEISLEEKKKLFSLFLNMKDDEKASSTLDREKNSDVLIVDGYNTFIRCFTANPMMNDDGLHTGGVAGFLKSVGYALKLINPTRCVIIFDGVNGSMRRRSIYPDYKGNKKSKLRLNRMYDELAADEDVEENMKRQIIRTIDYIGVLPVSFISIDNVEADDTIAYCAVQYFKKNVNIMSSDKDFLQLVDDRVKVWSPTKRRMYGPAEVHTDYGIHPSNFVFYRALDGDTSDNISGIRGFGPKTALKAFPMLGEQRKVSLNELYNHAQINKDKLKVYETFLEHKNDFERNIALMQLSDTYLTTHAQLHVNGVLDNKIPRLNRYQLLNYIREDRLGANIPNHLVWINETFAKLDTII